MRRVRGQQANERTNERTTEISNNTTMLLCALVSVSCISRVSIESE